MAIHTEDMSQVPEQGERVDIGTYRVRISKVEEKESNSGKPMVIFTAKIQDEGKQFGRSFPLLCSLQPNALFNLKAVYTAAGYKPGPEGHDPDQILDAEFYVHVEHGEYEGKPVLEIKPYFITSLEKGPFQPRS